MKNIEKDQKSERELIEELRKKYTDIIYTCKTNEELVKPLVNYAYEIGKHDLPWEIVIVDSPPAIYHLMAYIEEKNNKITDQEINKWVKEWASTSHNWKEYTAKVYPLYNYLNIADYNWVAYYELQQMLGKTNIPPEFPKYKSLITANLFCVSFYDHLAICCRSPTQIKLDDRRRLHSWDGPALLFPDKTGYFFINGNNIEPKLFHQVIDHQTSGVIKIADFKDRSEETDPAVILTMTNTELKSYLIEHIGYEKMLEHIPGVKQIDKEKFRVKAHDEDTWHWWTGILFEFPFENSTVHLLRVQNPHDKRPAYLITDRTKMTVKESTNSTFGLPPDTTFEFES